MTRRGPGPRRALSGKPLLARAIPFWDNASGPEILLALTLVGAPLAIGGVHLESKLLLGVLAVVAFVWAAARRRGSRSIQVGFIGLALAVAVSWSFLQWVPLPAGLVEVVSPGSWESRRLAAEALGTPAPAWLPLSLDGGRTAAAWIGLLATLMVYLLAANVGQSRDARGRVLVYVEVAAMATLVVSVCHKLLGLGQIYGFYQATVDVSDRLLITPFVNPNHAAALFLLGAVVAFGAWLQSTNATRLHLFSGVALSMGVVASLSRANTLLLVLALLVTGAFVMSMRRYRSYRRKFVRLAIGVGCFAFVAVILVGPDVWLEQLGSLSDLEAHDVGLVSGCWQVGATLASDFALTGTGHGAFAVAASGIMTDWSAGLVAYAHNAFLQAGAELGIPLALLVCTLFVVGLGKLVRPSTRHLGRLAALVAVCMVLLQNQIDFSLYLPGVGLPFAALLGWLAAEGWAGAATGEGASRRPPVTIRWRSFHSVFVVGALVVTSLHAWAEQPLAIQAEVERELAEGKPGRVALNELMLAHPNDFHVARLGALLSQRLGQHERSSRLMALAHRLAPHEPETLAGHVGQTLAGADRTVSMALIDRLTSQGNAHLTRVTAAVLGRREEPELLVDFFSRAPERIAVGAGLLTQRREDAAAAQLLRWGIGRFPDSLKLHQELGRVLFAEGTKLDELEAISARILARATSDKSGSLERQWARAAYLLQAQIHMKKRMPAHAWHLYTEAAALVPESATHPLLAAGKAAYAMKAYDRLQSVLAQLEHHEIRGAWPLGEKHLLKSYLLESRDDLRGALREMHHTIRYLGHVPSFHRRLAKLFALSGDEFASERASERAQAAEQALSRARPLDL